MNTFHESNQTARSQMSVWSMPLAKSGKSLMPIAALVILLGNLCRAAEIPVANGSFDTFLKPDNHAVTGSWNSIGIIHVNDGGPVIGWVSDDKVIKFSDGSYAGNDKSASKGTVDMLGWQRVGGPDWGITLSRHDFGQRPRLTAGGDSKDLHFGTGDWTAINRLAVEAQTNATYTLKIDVGYAAKVTPTADVLNEAVIELHAGQTVLTPESVSKGDYGSAPLTADTIKTWRLTYKTDSFASGKLAILLGNTGSATAGVSFFKVELDTDGAVNSSSAPASSTNAAASRAEYNDLIEASLKEHSIVSMGDTTRLKNVMMKARRGDSLTIAVIGGSITGGAVTSTWEKQYGMRVLKWWQNTFPNAEFKYVNAGIGGTGSDYAVMRAQRDLLSKNPDFVITEFAVNDADDERTMKMMDGLARQILSQPNQPADMLLFMVFTMDGHPYNAQKSDIPVGEHYGLPMVSFQDVVWPPINAGHFQWPVVLHDGVHPNDYGHDIAAKCVISVLENVRRLLPSDNNLLEIPPLPSPLITDVYATCDLRWAGIASPVRAEGWKLEEGNWIGKWWSSSVPGSELEFDVVGTAIMMNIHRTSDHYGKADVFVDEVKAAEIGGWINEKSCNRIVDIGKEYAPGHHKVLVRVSSDASQSDNNNVQQSKYRNVLLTNGYTATGNDDHAASQAEDHTVQIYLVAGLGGK